MQEKRLRGARLAQAVLLGLVAGAAAHLHSQHLWSALTYGLVAVGASAVAVLTWRGAAHLSERIAPWLMFACVASAAFGLAGASASVHAASALAPALEGRDLEIVGVVASLPQPTDTGLRFQLRVESANDRGVAVTVPRLVQLGWYAGALRQADDVFELQRSAASLQPGQRWRLTVRLRAPHGSLNPHGFDLELWWWEQGVQATGYVRAGPRDASPELLAQTWHHPVARARHAVRESIRARVADGRAAGVLMALVVGDQAAIERADWDTFRATGVAHLMSISGLHVTMFAWMASLLAGALWRRSARLSLTWPAQHAAMVGGLVLACAYAAFSGGGVPAQRTLWMLCAFGLLRMWGRAWPWPWAWLFAAAVVVTLDPLAMAQPGFWLSFVAVGVLFASGSSTVATGRARVVALLREQAVVTVALTPLSMVLFGQVSVVGFIANLVAIPAVTLVVTPLAMAGVFHAVFWDAGAWAIAALTAWLDVLARLPSASLWVPRAPAWAAACGVAGGLLFVMRLPWTLRCMGVPLMLPVLLWQPVRPGVGEFELLAADVGQGNAVIVRTAHHTLVYDAGPRWGPESDAGARVLLPLLRASGDRVDMLVLSHRDSDHSGGAAAVLAAWPRAAFLSSLEAAHELQSLRPATRCVAGQRWQWDGVEFEILHPAANAYAAAHKPNAVSCVLRVAASGESVLLAGDIEQAQERQLQAQPIASRVLLVPHHGSKTSSSAAFIDAVRPTVALVQAGWRNRFGHPAPAVIDRYQQRGVQVVETARCGAVHWHSREPHRVGCERLRRPRYWRHAVDPGLP